MRTICEPIEAIGKIIEKSNIKQDADYRLSDHCVLKIVDEGVLLYHTLTCELLFLNGEEAELLKSFPGTVPECLKSLALKRFLVPVDTDEMTYSDQLRYILSLSEKKDDAVTSYTIFTTTDCNARCFYCYELGRSRIPMSEETAQRAGEYISEHCKGKPVRLHWFGGEPLFNTTPIDVIIAILKDKGVEYTSDMISNGYLFDESLIKKAKDEWKLAGIQITLDGTEEIYNHRKAYIYNEGSAYRRVLKNIGLLLDADIQVNIRLNLDANNQEDLYRLVSELSETFVSKNKPSVYNSVIYEQQGENRSEEKRRELWRMSNALTEHINRCGFGRQDGIPRFFKLNQCMADADFAVTITPEGRLGKCEHFSEEEEMFGNIWSEEKDYAVIKCWKEKQTVLPECKTCFYYPRCIRLRKCSTQKEYCDLEFKETVKELLKHQMLTTYENRDNKAFAEKEEDYENC